MLDFQRNLKEMRDKGINLVAASCDPLEKAVETKNKYSIEFPVGYGLDARAVSALIGAFYADDDAHKYLHATGFILNPEGKVVNGAYSTSFIGRFVAKDAIGLIEYLQKG